MHMKPPGKRLERLFDRLLPPLLYFLGVLLIAGIIHIVSVLLMPDIAQQDGFSRLAALGTPGQLVLLPRPEPGREIAPFTDPALVQGLCLFDLDKAPLSIRGEIDGGGLVTLSFRTKSGGIFYAMTDKATQRGAVDIRILTADQSETLEGEDDEQEPLQELRLVAPERTGLVLINAFVPFPSARADVEAQIKSLTCMQEPLVSD
jgi:uncharacterized membrane protein